MSSWPALFAAAVAMWLILKGPAAKKPSWVQKLCRFAMAFFLYSGFLYLLKWNPFWRWMPSVDFENRNRAEGFLILGSKTLPLRDGVFPLLRLLIPLEMESILEVDAVRGLREPKQGGRFSDPGFKNSAASRWRFSSTPASYTS